MFILYIVSIAAVIYFIVKPSRQHGFTSVESARTEEILKKRFVSGEIDAETYKRMLRTLQSY